MNRVTFKDLQNSLISVKETYEVGPPAIQIDVLKPVATKKQRTERHKGIATILLDKNKINLLLSAIQDIDITTLDDEVPF